MGSVPASGQRTTQLTSRIKNRAQRAVFADGLAEGASVKTRMDAGFPGGALAVPQVVPSPDWNSRCGKKARSQRWGGGELLRDETHSGEGAGRGHPRCELVLL